MTGESSVEVCRARDARQAGSSSNCWRTQRTSAEAEYNLNSILREQFSRLKLLQLAWRCGQAAAGQLESPPSIAVQQLSSYPDSLSDEHTLAIQIASSPFGAAQIVCNVVNVREHELARRRRRTPKPYTAVGEPFAPFSQHLPACLS